METWNEFLQVRLYPLGRIIFEEFLTLSGVFLAFITFLIFSWHVPPFEQIWNNFKVGYIKVLF